MPMDKLPRVRLLMLYIISTMVKQDCLDQGLPPKRKHVHKQGVKRKRWTVSQVWYNHDCFQCNMWQSVLITSSVAQLHS